MSRPVDDAAPALFLPGRGERRAREAQQYRQLASVPPYRLTVLLTSGIMMYMIKSWADQGSQDVYDGSSTKAAEKSLPKELWAAAGEKLDQMDAARSLADLRLPPSNRLHSLRDDLKGFHSISINMKYRIIFKFVNGDCEEVQITNHYE